MREQILGGLYGALIGDAVGVPYEFKSVSQLPPYEDIDITPPAKFKRSWSTIPVGTYSDDGAQLLLLTECLLDGKRTAAELHHGLKMWLNYGYMSVDNVTFDVGNQTGAALRTTPDVVISNLSDARFNGNGSLMRALAVPLVIQQPKDIVDVSMEMSKATHPHIRSQLCCALYGLIAHYMMHGQTVQTAIDQAFVEVGVFRPECPEELAFIKQFESNEFTGTGYVVDSLWSALAAVWRSTSYEDAIKKAIQYGDDTDTTACIAGGLAGIQYGYSSIPLKWLMKLRGENTIAAIAKRLTD